MKKIFQIILIIISYLWQLPQHFLAVIILLIYIKDVRQIKTYKHCVVININKFAGVSLGIFIFLNNSNFANDRIVKHEYGHSLQSLLLGWLYLIVIGIPSYLNHLKWKNNPQLKVEDYYKQYPERWADIWGKAL